MCGSERHETLLRGLWFPVDTGVGFWAPLGTWGASAACTTAVGSMNPKLWQPPFPPAPSAIYLIRSGPQPHTPRRGLRLPARPLSPTPASAGRALWRGGAPRAESLGGIRSGRDRFGGRGAWPKSLTTLGVLGSRSVRRAGAGPGGRARDEVNSSIPPPSVIDTPIAPPRVVVVTDLDLPA